MKYLFIEKVKFLSALLILATILHSCNKNFLELKPLNSVTPDNFLNNEQDLSMYTINLYSSAFPGFYSDNTRANAKARQDNESDNQVTDNSSYQYWVKGEWRVPTSDANWGFGRIRSCNYFIERILKKIENNENIGKPENVNYYLGEAYFFRAWEYFDKLRRFGDFPIVKNTLVDDKTILIEASRRMPRNEVARFIISDLDSAALLMGNTQMSGNNRLSRKVALLIKSRVALFEASWLTYFAGTPFVPGDANWPGKSLNPTFQIDLNTEISFFLTQAMAASKEVADMYPLTPNSGRINPPVGQPWGWNPYYEMFCANDMEAYPEILLWRGYNRALPGFTHGGGSYAFFNGSVYGFTREYIDGFLMKNGLPIYATNSGYQGDTEIWKQKAGRDDRLQLFVWGEKDTLKDFKTQFGNVDVARTNASPTGFHYRKYGSYDENQLNVGTSSVSQDFPAPIFRAAEAYLNYIEACYMKNGSLDNVAIDYWKQIRRRAGISDDLEKTILNTDLTKEADWAKYSGNNLIDETLFNIRRERRNEFILEDFRWDDLKRWRSLDMVKNYIVEGFNLWDFVYNADFYKEEQNILVPYPGSGGKTPNVSSNTESKYLRPYQILSENNKIWNGLNWSKANYLNPLPFLEFQLTSADPSQIGTSVLYQNPYWPVEANGVALE